MPTKSGILDYFPGTPREAQKETLLQIEEHWNDADVFIVNLPVACHGRGQRVLMQDGDMKEIQDVVVGDKLLGPDGKARTVLELHSGKTHMVKIIPKRGNSYTVTTNHKWPILEYRRPMIEGARIGRMVVTLMSTEQLLTRSADKANNQWLVTAGQSFSEKVLPICPYLLGVWLGDGSSRESSVTTMDDEIRLAWKEEAHRRDLDFRFNKKENSKAATYRMTHGKKGGTANSFTQSLIDLNVRNNKHIPLIYKTGSREQRLKLLAGLIDTDGHVNKDKNSIEITQKRKTLAEDIAYVVRSLGWWTSLNEKAINGVSYWRLHISGKLEELPCRVTYKKNAIVNSVKDQSNRKFKIEDVGYQEYFGITVDGDSLYLLDDFTITHNSGKSRVAMTISRWAWGQKKKQSSIITPTNVLVDQYKADFPRVASLSKAESYDCVNNKDKENVKLSCSDVKRQFKKCCSNCPYVKDLRKNRVVPYGIYNYYIYMAHKLFRPVLIADEAHNLVPMIADLAEKKLWKHDYDYPDSVINYRKLLTWITSSPRLPYDKKLQLLHRELTSGAPKYVVTRDVEALYHGKERDVLKLSPIDVSDQPPTLWPMKKVEKIVLLSATLGTKDVEQLGLDRRRVLYLNAASPIPARRRPVTTILGLSMAYRNIDNNLNTLADRIKVESAKRPGQKGLIHVTYDLAAKIRPLLEKDNRYLFHDRDNKMEVYQRFRELPANSGAILVASGLYEGIDLPEDLGRFQMITKVPWPSMAEPAVKYMAETDPERYAWEAAKIMLQACGRICRTPTDYGETLILDSTFKRLYNEYQQFFPGWWKDAYREIGE